MDLVFFALLGVFFTHELDAVKRHEWRVLPLTSFLPDRLGEQVFIWAHVPVFALILWGGDGQPSGPVRIAVAAFAIVHVVLHWIYRSHPKNEFNTWGSWTLILLAGALGAVFLVLAFWGWP